MLSAVTIQAKFHDMIDHLRSEGWDIHQAWREWRNGASIEAQLLLIGDKFKMMRVPVAIV